MTRDVILNFNSHGIVPKLGYAFNPPISGHFDVFPDGNIGMFDLNNSTDKGSIVYHWFPVI